MRAYLDHAAATDMLQCARIAMSEHLAVVGNASAVHAQGRAARRVVEESREAVAHALGVGPAEVVFTSGGTESDNAGVKGLWWARRAQDDRRRRILVGASEHHAVLEAAQWLARREGAAVTPIPVTRTGALDLSALADQVAREPESVALVAAMWANNEVGTVSDIPAAAALCAEHGIPLHVDAVQAVGPMPVDARPATTLALSAHKFGGPPGVGALIVARAASPDPLLHGGGQERSLRSGTVNVAAVAGMAAALEHWDGAREATFARVAGLREALVTGARTLVPDVEVNGSPSLGAYPHPDRLAGIAHLSFPGCRAESMLMVLDAAGVSVSTGAACSAGVNQPSHVLAAMGQPAHLSASNLRLSLGHSSSHEDVARFLDALPAAVERARMRGPEGRARLAVGAGS